MPLQMQRDTGVKVDIHWHIGVSLPIDLPLAPISSRCLQKDGIWPASPG